MSALVIKLGGALLDDAEILDDLVAQLTSLHAAGQSFVVVHGGGQAVDAQLARLGLCSEKHQGQRITPAAHLPQIVGVLAGQLNARLCAALLAVKLPAVGLTLADGMMTRARKAELPGVELGCVGRVRPGSKTLLTTLLADGFIPVISSIAQVDGQSLNVNADDAAEVIATLLGAEALVLLTDVAGVLDGRGELVPVLNAAQIEAFIAEGIINGGMTPKVRAALAASRSCGAPVVISHWRRAAALAEFGQGAVSGSMIVA